MDVRQNAAQELPTKPNNNITDIQMTHNYTYMQGLCESIKNIFNKYDIQACLKGNRTIKNILVLPKDKVKIQQKMV